MLRINRVKNAFVFVLWGLFLIFAVTFNNHSNWILLFFITPLLIALLIMLYLPLDISIEGLAQEMTLMEGESLETRVYTRTHVRFRLLNIQLFSFIHDDMIHSDIKMLPSKKHQELSLNTHNLNRGIYPIDQTTLCVRDFIGLYTRCYHNNTLQSIVVCPEINASSEHVAAYLDRRFNIQAPYRNRETFDVKQLREYIPGDRVNRIDWKLSSKTDTLIYREYTHENDKPVVFVYVAVSDERAEWMLSLFYTLETQFFKGTTLQFGLMNHEYTPNPINRDYAELTMTSNIDTGTIRHDAVLFTPKRLNLTQSNMAQVYCDKRLLVFEQAGRRDIIGELDENGVLS